LSCLKNDKLFFEINPQNIPKTRLTIPKNPKNFSSTFEPVTNKVRTKAKTPGIRYAKALNLKGMKYIKFKIPQAATAKHKKTSRNELKSNSRLHQIKPKMAKRKSDRKYLSNI
jgi:hypothetical protein